MSVDGTLIFSVTRNVSFLCFPIHVPVDEMLSFLYILVNFPRAVGISSEQI